MYVCIAFSEIFEEPLVDCNDDDDCPKILSCNEMSTLTPSGKKGYCVFRPCQVIKNKNSTWTNELACPTIGNVCTVGSISGTCFRESGLTCIYERALTIAKCGKKEHF